jgi:hypothetical protein
VILWIYILHGYGVVICIFFLTCCFFEILLMRLGIYLTFLLGITWACVYMGGGVFIVGINYISPGSRDYIWDYNFPS